jgi:putative cell wall-binding protein
VALTSSANCPVPNKLVVTFNSAAPVDSAPTVLTISNLKVDLGTGFLSNSLAYLTAIASSGMPFHGGVGSNAVVVPAGVTVAGSGAPPASGGGGSTGPGVVSGVGRLAGADRFATAVAVSKMAYFGADSAGAVVLARADGYADALVGGPLAAAKKGPILFTSGPTLPSATLDELTRVLTAGKTVYLLGGPASIPDSVASQVDALGYTTVRIAGSDRYGTALAVAAALGNPTTVLLVTGTAFADALSAGPAASHVGGALLLTDGSTMPSATAAYLAAHAGTVYAIGGPAATADPEATAVVGTDRYATAVAVAGRFFVKPPAVGIASGVSYPDALAAAPFLAHGGGPLVLTDPTALSTVTAQYLTTVAGGTFTVFGASGAVSDQDFTEILAALN